MQEDNGPDLTFYPQLAGGAVWSCVAGTREEPLAPDTWVWSPGLQLVIEATLDDLNSVIAAGWQYVTDVPEIHNQHALLPLWGQLGHTRVLHVAGSSSHQIWAATSDLERVKRVPVILSFTVPDELAAQGTTGPVGVTNLQIAEVLPPPQFGEVAMTSAESEGVNGYRRLTIGQLGEDAQALQRRLSDALRELAAPADWWPVTDLLTKCASPGYRRTRTDMQSRLLASRGKVREEIRTQLDELETANTRYKTLQVAHYWFSRETWLERWAEVRAMAQQLAVAYWEAHQAALEEARHAASARKLPQIPDIFPECGQVPIPSMMPVQAPLLAYSHAQSGNGWTADDDGYPTFTHTTENHSTSMQVRPGESTTMPDETAIQALWQQVREYSDLDGDVFLAMLAQAMVATPDDEGYTWITGGRILDYRGIAPIMKRESNDVARRAGHRTEDLIDIARCVDHQASQWVVIRSRIIEDSEAKGKRRSRRTMQTRESRLTQVAEVIRQHELDIMPEDGPRSPSYPIAWRYRMGTWLTPFLEGPNRKVAWLCQQALKYDPMREQWEKRLARYFVFHLRINAAGGSASIKRNVGKLIDELALPVDERHPERTRRRLEQALDRLEADGQIDTWEYDRDNAALPPRKWLETWRGWHVRIGAAAITSAKYAPIAEHAQTRRDRAAALHELQGRKAGSNV